MPKRASSRQNNVENSARKYSRRHMLAATGQTILLAGLGLPACSTAQRARNDNHGAIIGEEAGAAVGRQVLAEGGNAVDAAVAAALTSCVATPARCGIGGYGGHMTLCFEGGKKITSIDFNSTAPAAAHGSMYTLEPTGEVKGRANFHGWLAVGVPGTLAGLQLALDKFGTRTFRQLVQPAIKMARDGVVVTKTFASAIQAASPRFRADPGSAKLYLKDGQPPKAGQRLPNPDLAAMLSTLAGRNSVDSFYRGDIAKTIADQFQKRGGLVTVEDLAKYHAREVKPLRLQWDEFDVYTAPLTAGGLTVLEALAILKSLNRRGLHFSPATIHSHVEILRLAWKDRLDLLGDPEQGEIPVEKLLSEPHAAELAEKVRGAVRSQKPMSIDIQKHLEDGTNNLSCVDREGNLVALTLTQGGGFGAQVTVDGFGLTLGHGMSRFNPHPGHPNSPAPGKRPLHNMCPSILTREGKPAVALGGAGGVRIPNALYNVLARHLGQGQSIEEAVGARRLHCTGLTEVTLEQGWPQAEADRLKEIGFSLKSASEIARISAVTVNNRTGETRATMR